MAVRPQLRNKVREVIWNGTLNGGKGLCWKIEITAITTMLIVFQLDKTNPAS